MIKSSPGREKAIGSLNSIVPSPTRGQSELADPSDGADLHALGRFITSLG